MHYYRAFKNKYIGISQWHRKLQDEAFMTNKVVLPSGRQYFFPNIERLRSGSVTNSTAIKNYPVQGFATADLLPIALIKLKNLLTKYKLKTIICNTVHDSITLDVYPKEEQQAIKTLKEAMMSLSSECERRYGFKYTMPIGIELKIGDNWLNMKEVYKTNG
jgi:DNA polymerase I-like protein with 3'-5' exonuclease and polymerase domains